MGEIIKVSKCELTASDEHTKRIEEQNVRLVALRKKQIYDSLKESTLLRIKTAKNISNWIQMLSDKIFNPQTVEEMDLNKAIALFKYVNNINLKVLSESNRLEEVLGKYIESGVMDAAARIGKQGDVINERERIKHEIFSKLNKMFKESVSDVDVVNVDAEPSGLTPEEQTELDNAEKNFADNLASIDSEVEVDLSILDDEEDES
jgi:hypothetical protein